MKNNKYTDSLYAIAVIMGTVIGAGILGLPYAISRTGLIPGLMLMGVIAFCLTLLMLYLAEISLRCRRVYQLPGLVSNYLGKNYKIFITALFIVSIYAALIGYIIGVSGTLSHMTGADSLIFKLIFLGVVSAPITIGLNAVKRFQLGLVLVTTALITTICFIILPQVNLNNLSYTNHSELFFPFGVIFFALTGYSVMPELEKIMKRNKIHIDNAIVIAMITCTLLYTLFTIAFIGIYGLSVAQVATESLTDSIGILGNLIAVIGMTTCFLGLGLALKNSYKQDMKLNNWLSSALVLLPPVIFTLIFELDFIEPIRISGAITGTITGFLIILTVNKARKVKGDKPAFITPFGKAGMILVSAILTAGLASIIMDLIGLI